MGYYLLLGSFHAITDASATVVYCVRLCTWIRCIKLTLLNSTAKLFYAVVHREHDMCWV